MDREAEILQRLSNIERKLEALNETGKCLADCINSYDTHVKEMTVIWKHEVKEKLNLSNTQAGLPRIDDNAIIALSKQGLTIKAIAERLNCSIATVTNHKRKLKAQGRIV